MAPFTVALEHPVVVPVVAGHDHLVLLDLLLGLQPVLLVMPVPAAALDELLTGALGDCFTVDFFHVVLPLVNPMVHKVILHRVDAAAAAPSLARIRSPMDRSSGIELEA